MLRALLVLAVLAIARADIYAVPEGTVVDQWHEPPMPEQLHATMTEYTTGPLLPSNEEANPEDLARAEKDDDAFFANSMPDQDAEKVYAELEDARDAAAGDDMESFLEVDMQVEEDEAEEEHDDDQDAAEPEHDEANDEQDHSDEHEVEDNSDNSESQDTTTEQAPAATDNADEAPTSPEAVDSTESPAAPMDKPMQGILTDPEDATRDETSRLAAEAEDDAWDLDDVDFREGQPSLKNEFMDVMLEIGADAEDQHDAHTEVHLGEADDAEAEEEEEHHAITLDDAKEILTALDINPVSE